MDKYRYVGIITTCSDKRLEGKKLYLTKEDFRGEIMSPILVVHYTRYEGNRYTLNDRLLEGDVRIETV